MAILNENTTGTWQGVNKNPSVAGGFDNNIKRAFPNKGYKPGPMSTGPDEFFQGGVQYGGNANKPGPMSTGPDEFFQGGVQYGGNSNAGGFDNNIKRAFPNKGYKPGPMSTGPDEFFRGGVQYGGNTNPPMQTEQNKRMQDKQMQAGAFPNKPGRGMNPWMSNIMRQYSDPSIPIGGWGNQGGYGGGGYRTGALMPGNWGNGGGYNWGTGGGGGYKTGAIMPGNWGNGGGYGGDHRGREMDQGSISDWYSQMAPNIFSGYFRR